MDHKNADTSVPASHGHSVQMDPVDHHETRSNGRHGKAAAEYRQETKKMIESGKYRDAMAREVKDIRNAAEKGSGNRSKYNEAIREMLNYARQSNQLQ